MATLQDFQMPVHKSLLQPDLIMGVPKNVFMLIFLITAIFVYLFGKFGALVAIPVYIPCKILCKTDPHMLTIALESLMEPDHLEAV